MKKSLFTKLMATTMLFSVVFVGCNKENETEKVVSVKGVTLDKEFLTLDMGKVETLIATIHPKNASNQTLIWESSIPTVASVFDNGLVTALSPGIATISARTEDGNKMATCEVTVNAVEVSKIDLLTQGKGWKLTRAISNPPFELGGGAQITNLLICETPCSQRICAKKKLLTLIRPNIRRIAPWIA